MVRPIDADALLENGIKVEYGFNDNGLILIPMRDVRNSIKNAPTINAKPVKRGHWIFNPDWKLSKCSECGETGLRRWKRCPYCEAKMDKEETE